MATASDQLARLLALLPWLQAHPGVTKTAAAAAFGVTTGQLEKDLQLAFTCELPGQPEVFIDIDYLDSDRISVIDPASINRPLRLRSDEAVALLVGLRALAAVPGLQDRAALDGALAKLEDATGLAGLTAQEPGRPAPAPGVAAASAVRAGLAAHRRLHLRYWVPTRDEVTERDVDPLRIVSVDDTAYLEGYCYASESVRTFRLDRIIEAVVLDAAADPPVSERVPPDSSAGVFRPSATDELVTLDLDPSARWVPDYYACESVVERPGGGVRVTLRTSDPRLVVRLALRLSGAAEVIAPNEIRAEVTRMAYATLRVYGVSHPV